MVVSSSVDAYAKNANSPEKEKPATPGSVVKAIKVPHIEFQHELLRKSMIGIPTQS